ncbi:unnamed protein product [Phyllotreta striolata]|uniref:LITAF domain-containing protein n=1 Tax=Phyllotreta striolata TaxID=444603 RepID=A0A9N9TNC4_PHYSR|nr:unnamed protein product [Phyllotreta striolata]
MYEVGWLPSRLTCPNCRNAVSTRVDFIPTDEALLLGTLLAICCLCWLPACLTYAKVARHRCGACGIFIGDSAPLKGLDGCRLVPLRRLGTLG